MLEKRMLVDTTLRDGEQMPGIAFCTEDKLRIAHLLDKLGVYEIEAGTPCIGSFEKECIEQIIMNRKNSKISVWSRMQEEDIKASVSCKPDIIHIGAPVSYVQIYSKLKKNKNWMQKTLFSCVDKALEAGINVTVGFEDASRADVGFMISLINKLSDLGVSTVRLADTVGVLMPDRTERIIAELAEKTDMGLEFHAHNDLGMALANSIQAAKSGAKYIDCTLLGIGERCGNCDLYSFVHATNKLYNWPMECYEIKKVEEEFRAMIEKAVEL